MIITATQSGGFTGWTQRLGPADTGAIQAGDAAEAAVRAADFFSLPPHFPGQSHVEMVSSVIEVTDGEKSHSVSWVDSSQDPAIARLIGIVSALLDAGVEWSRVAL